ncbi:MAG: hypothetical protein JSV84_08030 [Gemmatimonadota bacterium]|nr:MAG: hypothetical protein JSV84_08030 [Gemmatimonadota bacterium]
MHILKHVHLYDAPSAGTLHTSELIDYVGQRMGGIPVTLRGEFFGHQLSGEDDEMNEVAERLARCKVRSLEKPEVVFKPLPAEVDYERKFLRRPESKPFGILYDGVTFLRILWEWIPDEERNHDHLHIVLSNQLLGTYDANDRRYHARVAIFGMPCVISTTGVIEGPARPKAFYLLKQQFAAIGRSSDTYQLQEQFRGEFVEHNDERMTEILKGYIMQAVFYHMTGDPFCDDPNCRLYNAHWQKEMIHAQLESPYEFCRNHTNVLQQFMH